MSNQVILEKISPVAVITFNRPHERSPLSIAVLENLHAILDELTADESIEKIVFTGKEDVFASGANLREIAAVTGETAREFALRGQSLMNKIERSGKQTIAAVNGYCFGGALDLALACERRIASPDAVFSHPGVGLGIMTGWGGTQRLPRLVGEAFALEMLLTAKRVGAEEALRRGLINRIGKNLLDDAIKFEFDKLKSEAEKS